ncbi:hydroxypyruvate isomerase family protein [Lacihabitans sp. CS3-21]|jgi:hydroxypyruvate isomerase|uniref:hydroxypyruvate isomerase family protein n=1 Tax=Lacihabitans sp. CS3-21 TaxID=2487332 RepID=UPI0020CC34B8|nr:TIM barrel protein [Lacihabitans sp. CS3-21]MCP9745509.1 xylose isomerase [Lacihabitans sp. CS3-21]
MNNRREFIKKSIGTASILSLGGLTQSVFAHQPKIEKNNFKMLYAPHFGMFKHSAGEDLFDQLQFMADNGFMALEDNGMLKRPVETQKKIGETLNKLGMKMGVFVIDGGENWKISLASGKPEFLENFLKTCRESVETAKRCNAKYMTVVPGFFERKLPMGIQTANVIDAYRRACDIFEPHGLVMVMEPLSDTPDLFLQNSDQSYLICKAVNSPSCKILFDMWHMQRNEGEMTRNMDLVWDEIAYFQIGDEPGRKEPTTGEINYNFLFKHIHDKAKANKQEFIMGMEHGNMFPGKEGEQKLIKAYVQSDNF